MPEGGALVEVTLRTIQSRLLLRPGPAAALAGGHVVEKLLGEARVN